MSNPYSTAASGIRVAIQQSIQRQTPKISFGDRLNQGRDASPTLQAVLDDLGAGIRDLEQYARTHSPAVVSALSSARAAVAMAAARAAQSAQQTTVGRSNPAGRGLPQA